MQVLVVGAGLGGLSATLFLARQGIRVLGVAKHAHTAVHPKATGQTPRTMEMMRLGGVEDAVMAGSVGGIVIKVAESLKGRVFQTIVPDEGEFDLSALSPAPFGMASQDHVEPVLLDRARELGAEVRFRTELVSFTQDDTGVTARLLDLPTGRIGTVRADYLVAADGHRGKVREGLGIERHGRGSLSHHIGVVFDADLTGHTAPDKTTLYYLQNPAFTGAFVTTNTERRNVLTVEYHPERGESAADYPEQRCVELLRTATDVPDLEPKIVDIARWEMAAWMADRFSSGRVFLVGDAAKVTPPTGGLGGNTAVQDGYDIAWKLAAVLKGEAGPGLLASYDQERRPYAQAVVDTSYHNYVERLAPQLKGPDVPEGIDPVELGFGFRCLSGAVLAEDDDVLENPYEPSGRAGFRAPHVVVERGGEQVSTVDLFGHGWVLVTLDPAWSGCGVEVPALTDPSGQLAAKYGIGERGASLVRPDGVVAWRSPDLVIDPAASVRRVLAVVLDR
ncbi:2-polyprenyl-6-methoxyphenol hydroxylase-like FAD-dependent oxidoreductase [Umezawaea tangerina]|uniref:2-polyprenyl-6-methoxyphenol hydroxylase-like FAD-dependent oxidoreductase n=1 Tax=Umezawaea tangerina TaxID=84725 RepID=A0A2T0TE54_9PSEU|nr:2-polyprenyl-6-methoxyphenol hydroxylase-like FAD-dependent oxidoreductase [Umezawaea tangerina]